MSAQPAEKAPGTAPPGCLQSERARRALPARSVRLGRASDRSGRARPTPVRFRPTSWGKLRASLGGASAELGRGLDHAGRDRPKPSKSRPKSGGFDQTVAAFGIAWQGFDRHRARSTKCGPSQANLGSTGALTKSGRRRPNLGAFGEFGNGSSKLGQVSTQSRWVQPSLCGADETGSDGTKSGQVAPNRAQCLPNLVAKRQVSTGTARTTGAKGSVAPSLALTTLVMVGRLGHLPRPLWRL